MINIITVNWNNLKGLTLTLNSLKRQTFDKEKWRLIVVDGFSTDGSQELLISEKSHIDTLIIEKDKGVYDAMNKGIENVNEGDYFLFLNSGDEFASDDVLKKLDSIIKNDNEKTNVFYGDKIDEAGKLKKPFHPKSMEYGIINACHQCILYRKTKGFKYDLKYRLFSDLDFTIKYYKTGSKFKYIPIPIAIYEGGGLSSVHKWGTKIEIYQIVYRQFGFVKFFRFISVKSLKFIGVKHTAFLNQHE